MAVIITVAMVKHRVDMRPRRKAEVGSSDDAKRATSAESLAAAVFEDAGWKVQRPKRDDGFDLIVRGRRIAYSVEVKSAPEGRSDRLVPLFAQAVLQAARAAGPKAIPLAIVVAPRIAPRAAEQVLRFAEEYAPDAAAGVIDFEGLALFRGPELEELNAQPKRVSAGGVLQAIQSGRLFSDLNQWMLKVLIAPEIPDGLLAAPRGRYRNASELARAAGVSVMSAFRFVRQLGREGYIHEAAPYLSLVRRQDLFTRWQGLAAQPAVEVPMRFVLRGELKSQLRRMFEGGRACLALFAAADALRFGHVQGVPPHVYLERVSVASLASWKDVRPCTASEAPDVILRQAPAVRSVFRGMVTAEGMAVSDVLQVWIDVGAHPARGREQADLIRKKVIRRVIEGGP
jgi:hypothetical protein